jgi:chromosome segregation ATPase
MNSSDFLNMIEPIIGHANMETKLYARDIIKLKSLVKKMTGIYVPFMLTDTDCTCLDFWNSINKEEEKRKQNSNAKRNNVQMSNNTSISIANKIVDIQLINNQLAYKLMELDGNINKEKKNLNTQLNLIEEATPAVDIGSYLGVIPKKVDIENSISVVYNNLCEFVRQCGSAIRSSNDNISNVLELIRLLAFVEAGIYTIIDNQALESNELHNIIKDWCKEHGIRDEEVDKLFEASFQRAYTLRDRINKLREDLTQQINDVKSETEQLSHELSNYQESIKNDTEEAIAKLEEKTIENGQKLNDIYAEKESFLNKLANDLQNSVNSEYDKLEELKETIRQKQIQFGEKVAKYNEDLKVQSEKTKSVLTHLKGEVETLFVQKSQDLNESINHNNLYMQERKDEMLALLKQIEQTNAHALKRIKRWIVWGGASIIGISCVLNLLLGIM